MIKSRACACTGAIDGLGRSYRCRDNDRDTVSREIQHDSVCDSLTGLDARPVVCRDAQMREGIDNGLQE